MTAILQQLASPCGLAFIYFIAYSPSAKHASLNCLFNDAQGIEWWPAVVVCLEFQKPRTNVLFQCLSRAFCSHSSVSIECRFVVTVACRSSVVL